MKGTNDILKSLRGPENIPASTILCTLDVERLYTNIPHRGGLEALNFFLHGETETNAELNTFLLEAAEIVSTENYFSLGRDFYATTQISM